MYCGLSTIYICFRYEESTKTKINWAVTAYNHWKNVRNFQVEKGVLPKDRTVPSTDELLAMDKESIVKVLLLSS